MFSRLSVNTVDNETKLPLTCCEIFLMQAVSGKTIAFLYLLSIHARVHVRAHTQTHV